MATAAQIEANRRNAGKSTGPRSAEGKNKSRFNGLKHGLRSNQVVLPGESAEEFDAELKGWRDDWRPRTHTQAVLCERAAAASWRLRRCVRAEADLLLDLADRRARRRAGTDGRAGRRDRDPTFRADDLADGLLAEPARALAEMRSFPEGVDRLVDMWGELAGDLGRRGARGWRPDDHELAMALLGRGAESDPAAAGPLAVDSRRLARANDLDDDDDDDEAEELSDAEAEALSARVLREIERRREALGAHRATLSAPPAEAGTEAEAEAEGCGAAEEGVKFVGVTKRILLLHRYEMAHERSMRAAMRDLLALEKAGVGAGRGADKSAEVVGVKKVADRPSEPASRPEPAASPAPSEPNPEAPRQAPGKPRRDRKGRVWPVEPAEGGGSSS